MRALLCIMAGMTFDYRALAERIMRPRRPKLEEAKRAVAGVKKTADAMQALEQAGLYAPDALRGFVSFREASTHKVPKGKPVPKTLAECITIASDFDAVLEAEKCARDVPETATRADGRRAGIELPRSP